MFEGRGHNLRATNAAERLNLEDVLESFNVLVIDSNANPNQDYDTKRGVGRRLLADGTEQISIGRIAGNPIENYAVGINSDGLAHQDATLVCDLSAGVTHVAFPRSALRPARSLAISHVELPKPEGFSFDGLQGAPLAKLIDKSSCRSCAPDATVASTKAALGALNRADLWIFWEEGFLPPVLAVEVLKDKRGDRRFVISSPVDHNESERAVSVSAIKFRSNFLVHSAVDQPHESLAVTLLEWEYPGNPSISKTFNGDALGPSYEDSIKVYLDLPSKFVHRFNATVRSDSGEQSTYFCRYWQKGDHTLFRATSPDPKSCIVEIEFDERGYIVSRTEYAPQDQYESEEAGIKGSFWVRHEELLKALVEEAKSRDEIPRFTALVRHYGDHIGLGDYESPVEEPTLSSVDRLGIELTDTFHATRRIFANNPGAYAQAVSLGFRECNVELAKAILDGDIFGLVSLPPRLLPKEMLIHFNKSGDRVSRSQASYTVTAQCDLWHYDIRMHLDRKFKDSWLVGQGITIINRIPDLRSIECLHSRSGRRVNASDSKYLVRAFLDECKAEVLPTAENPFGKLTLQPSMFANHAQASATFIKYAKMRCLLLASADLFNHSRKAVLSSGAIPEGGPFMWWQSAGESFGGRI